jgi:hypothetical protein
MQIGNIRLVLNTHGSDTPKINVTPAECQLLQSQFQSIAGGNPITQLVISKETEASVVISRALAEDSQEIVHRRKRTDKEEILRLTQFYGQKLVSKLFPGLNPKLPETFEEAGFVENAQFQSPAQRDTGNAYPQGPQTLDDFVSITGPQISEPALS